VFHGSREPPATPLSSPLPAFDPDGSDGGHGERVRVRGGDAGERHGVADGVDVGLASPLGAGLQADQHALVRLRQPAVGGRERDGRDGPGRVHEGDGLAEGVDGDDDVLADELEAAEVGGRTAVEQLDAEEAGQLLAGVEHDAQGVGLDSLEVGDLRGELVDGGIVVGAEGESHGSGPFVGVLCGSASTFGISEAMSLHPNP